MTNQQQQSGSEKTGGEEEEEGKNQPSGAAQDGRGWHGDSKGHAEAGRQSHKND